MLSVSATSHQGDIKYNGAGKQCTTNSLAAMLFTKEKIPGKWLATDLDSVLDKGDQLYQNVGLSKYLLISELPKQLETFSLKVVSSYCGTIDREITECPFYSLSDALKQIDKFCFLTLGCYTMAMIKSKEQYFLFDSHSRNDCGMPCPDGKSILTGHNSLYDLEQFVRHLCSKLFSNKNHYFEATNVVLEPYNVHEEDLQTSSSFSGFSEMSDGEYACKMFLTQERQSKLNTYLSKIDTLHSSNSDVSGLLEDIDDTASDSSSGDTCINYFSQHENMIDDAINKLDNSRVYFEDIDLNTIYNSVEESGESDEGIPLSFVAKKTKWFSRKRKPIFDNLIETGLSVDEETVHRPIENVDKTSEQNLKENDKNRCRKRVKNIESWRRNVSKRLRNEGKEYQNKYGHTKKARKMQNACGENCRFKCSKSFSLEERENIFDKFWRLGTIAKQRPFMIRYTTRLPKSHGQMSSRMYTIKYYFPFSNQPDIRICKTFFLKTLDISQTTLTTAHKKNVSLPGVVDDDERGKSGKSRHNIIEHEALDFIRNHIKSFKCYESHYCRKDSKKVYLDGKLNLNQMFKLYCKKCDTEHREKVKRHLYRKIFNTEFNISFQTPRKDLCDLCASFDQASLEEKSCMKIEYDMHIKNKALARENKEKDKEHACSDKGICVSCFDLEEVLITPKGFESSLYYKRRLNTFNFTIYEFGSKNGYAYIWNETIAGRGASEIASCVYNFIANKSKQGIKRFIFYSDNCPSQNKNKFYISMLWYCLHSFDLVSIEHKYLEKGHTFNENDSVHASIETKSRKTSVYTTPQWAAIIRTARPMQPYLVTEMSIDDFYDFKQICDCLKNFDLNELKQKVYISQIRTFKLYADEPNMYSFKYQHDSATYSKVNLLNRLRRSCENINAKSIALKQLRNELIPISAAKYNDLISLCVANIIPKCHHIFYILLPHSTELD